MLHPRSLHFLALLVALSAPLKADEPIRSLVASFSGDERVQGSMFDVVGPDPAFGQQGEGAIAFHVQGLTVNAAGPIAVIEVWIVTGGGSYRGVESSPARWTRIHRNQLPSVSPSGHPSLVSYELDVMVPMGGVQGFFVSASAPSLWNDSTPLRLEGEPAARLGNPQMPLAELRVGASANGFTRVSGRRTFNGEILGRVGYVVPGSATTIQAAIQQNVTGSFPILVRPGTYVENLDFLGRSIRLCGLEAGSGVVIDGRGQGPVVTLRSGESGAEISQLSITGGHGGMGEGGGVECRNNSSVTLTDCVLRSNRGGDNPAGIGGGGGISFRSTSMSGAVLALRACLIDSNQGGRGGSGADGGAGGVDATGLLRLESVNFYANSGGDADPGPQRGHGGSGGVHLRGRMHSMLSTNSSFLRNLGGAGSRGGAGAIHTELEVSHSEFVANEFRSNRGGSGELAGAGVYDGRASFEFENSTMIDNAAGPAGPNGGGPGVLRMEGTRSGPATRMLHCSVLENRRSGSAPGMADVLPNSEPLHVHNSILWAQALPQIRSPQNLPRIEYSDVEGGSPGVGNLDTDPRFEAPFTPLLSECSPCIDAGGQRQGLLLPTTDAYGNPRPSGAGFDMGAHEFSTTRRGTGDDFVLDVQVNGSPGYSLNSGDDFVVTLSSPGGALAWAPLYLLAQHWPCGSGPQNVTLPGLHIDATLPFLILLGYPDPVLGPPRLPPGGAGMTLAYRIPATAVGTALSLQGLAFSNAAANGAYATTDLPLFVFR